MHDAITTLTRQEIGFQHSFQYHWQFKQPKSNIFVYLVCACVYVRVHTFEFEHFLLWCVRVSMYGCVLNFEFELFLYVVCVCVRACVYAWVRARLWV